MNCRRVEEMLSDHLEGLLSRRESAAVSAHLLDCSACRHLRSRITDTAVALRELPAPLPSPELRRRALDVWTADQAAPLFGGQRWIAVATDLDGRLRPAIAALLLVALGITAVHWERSSRGEGRMLAALSDVSSRKREIGESAKVRRGKGQSLERGQRHNPIAPPTSPSTEVREPVLVSAKPSRILPSDFALSPISRFRDEKAGKSRRVSPTRDDLAVLNAEPVQSTRPWACVTPEVWQRLESRVRRNVRVQDDFVQIPFPRLATNSERQVVAAVESYKREAAIVDARLSREVTLQQKGSALSDLCDHLRRETSIHLTAAPSVADEKVTLFCEKQPLRAVMRQLSRPFGYTWLRSRSASGSEPNTEYRYELVQDLKSQLLEEELRNRDRNASLIALDQEIERYGPYMSLSPGEALARLKGAAPAGKKLLAQLSGRGWGPLHLYHRLSPQDQAALRSGQELRFSAEAKAGERPLPADIARGVLQSLRKLRILRLADGSLGVTTDSDVLDALTPAALPEARAMVTLKMRQSELGQFTLAGESGFFARGKPEGGGDTGNSGDDGPLAIGTSPAVHQPNNAAANAPLAGDPALRPRVTIMPKSDFSPGPGSGESAREVKVTTADVLQAVHQATGLPVVADYYTRLYAQDAVSIRNQTLFQALNHLADAMRQRWNRDGEWLQFRSTSYYDDRLKEVPNRLLNRWAGARRAQGFLSLDELVEIAGLPDAQLDGAEMAEGARILFGLAEWDLPRNWALRRHLRFLAGFTPAQRQEAMSPDGLAFTRMPLTQQQRFIATALEWDEKPLQSLEELEGAVLRVDYTQPGWYEWRVPAAGADWLQLVMPAGPGRRAPRPPIRAPTRQATLQAARQADSQLLEAMAQAARRLKPQLDVEQMRAQEAQIVPTELNLTILYMPGASHARAIRSFSMNNQSSNGTW